MHGSDVAETVYELTHNPEFSQSTEMEKRVH